MATCRQINHSVPIMTSSLGPNSGLVRAGILARIEREPNLDAHRYRLIWVDRKIDQDL